MFAPEQSRHPDRVENDLNFHVCCDQPADDYPGVCVDDETHVSNTCQGWHKRQVGYPELATGGCCAVTFHQVWMPRCPGSGFVVFARLDCLTRSVPRHRIIGLSAPDQLMIPSLRAAVQSFRTLYTFGFFSQRKSSSRDNTASLSVLAGGARSLAAQPIVLVTFLV